MTGAQVDRPSRAGSWLRAAAVAVLVVGIVCQFVQHTDPTFPLRYFTVDSALLTLVALPVAQLRPRWVALDGVRGAATVGVLLSGLIFATVLAPANNGGAWFAPHDDPWVRTATLLIHGVAPVLALADFLTHPQRGRSGVLRTAFTWCLWPLAWFVVAFPLDLAGVVEIPYTFLRVRQVGDVLPVAGSVVALLVIVVALGSALVAVHRRVHRGAGAASLPATDEVRSGSR